MRLRLCRNKCNGFSIRGLDGKFFSLAQVKFTQAMRNAGDAPYLRQRDSKLARDIRSFRLEQVQYLSDKQLVWVVERARQGAQRLGVTEPEILRRWIMADALLAANFSSSDDVARHFLKASGSPDDKAADVLQLLKITLRNNGRGDEVWW